MSSAKPVHTQRKTCRACGAAELELVLPLGETALANAFLRSKGEFGAERRYPLDVHGCRRCSLVQLVDEIAPEVLFREYLYVTGTSETMREHNHAYAAAVVELLGLGKRDLVVEVASNDGSLLKCLRAHGVRTLGVEPALNIAERASADGIETVPEFFDAASARRIRHSHGPAAAVVANNVLAHVDEPVEFLRAARSLLAPGGLVIVEVPWLRELLERLEYDTVYHEHLSYFSAGSLMRLCEEAGLRIRRIDRVSVHGGSLRMYAAPESEQPDHASEVRALAEEEDAAGLGSIERLRELAAAVEANRAALLELLRGLKRDGASLAGYGAPAKGNTLLQYCGIGPELLPYTVDRNPLKIGLFTPGSHIPVLPVETLLERRPDYVLILAWNFAEEIVRQQAEYAHLGGRFILPLPVPRIV